MVEPNVDLPKDATGVADPNPVAPNLGPAGVVGAPNVAGAGLLKMLLVPPGVGIFEGDLIFGAASGVSDVEVELLGMTRPGYRLPSMIERFQTTQYADNIPW